MLRREFILGGLLVCHPLTAAADTGWSAEVEFSPSEAVTIRAWFRDHAGELERGGRGRGKSLPPGIAKNLARGKPLPPGIAKQALPVGLVDRLPPVRRGYERVMVDGKVLLVEIATQIVHDVLTDVLLR